MSTNNNPLQKFFRQPKIYIKLPSSGNYYPPGAINKSSNDEYPVYAMTAKDELVMKTPDALLNGQATVDMIQSCVPNIVNAWEAPTIDVDALLIAIRIATYGENIEIEGNVPNTEITNTYTANLSKLLAGLLDATFDPIIEINPEMSIEIRPLTYREFTKSAIKTLEEQRIFRIINDESVTDEKRIEQFNKSFKVLTEITMGMVTQCVVAVRTPEFTVTNHEHISEFIESSDKDFFTRIIKHLEVQKAKFQMMPFKVNATEEEIKLGAPESFEIPVTLDGSTFFA